MSIDELPLSTQSLLEAIGEDVPDAADHARCSDYAVEFARRADSREAEGRAELAAACRFLGAMASLRLNPDNPRQPFEPYPAMHCARSPVLDDFADAQLQLVAGVAGDIADPELRARIADVLWIRKRDHNCARTAIAAYLESAKRILGDPLIGSEAVERLERGLQIAAMLGKQQVLFEQTMSTVDEVASDVAQPNFVSARCLDVILRFDMPEPERLARVAESRAASAAASPNWQRRFLDLAGRFYNRAGKEDDASRCGIETAKLFEREAGEVLGGASPSRFLVAAHSLESAIQAYRRVTGTDADRERVHLHLVEIQKNASAAIPTFKSEPIDLSDAGRASRAEVRGKTFADSLRTLALAWRVPSVEQMRLEAEDDIRRHPLAFFFPATTLSRTGKVVDRQGAMSSGSAGDHESLVRRQMYWRLERLHRPLCVIGVIEPMRFQILVDHYVRYADLWALVAHSRLVPQGREYFFVRGLHAGLHGDFVEALHILVPQFEHSIRCILADLGVVTSTLDANGVQQELDLNALLYVPKVTDIFGQDIVFELRGLLVEQASSNFRNQLAHGMLEYGSFAGESAVYIWWLILRLCVIGTLPQPAG